MKYKNMSSEHVISWKSKGVCNSKLTGLNNNFLTNIKYFEKKKGIQCNNTPLVIKQNNYTVKIVNVYMVYNLEY